MTDNNYCRPISAGVTRLLATTNAQLTPVERPKKPLKLTPIEKLFYEANDFGGELLEGSAVRRAPHYFPFCAWIQPNFIGIPELAQRDQEQFICDGVSSTRLV